jgi:hypothetical protein
MMIAKALSPCYQLDFGRAVIYTSSGFITVTMILKPVLPFISSMPTDNIGNHLKKQVRPTQEELPGFANQPKPYHSKKATAAGLAFISQCLEMVKLDYKENVQGRGLLAKPNHLLSLIILFAVVVSVLLAIQKVLS